MKLQIASHETIRGHSLQRSKDDSQECEKESKWGKVVVTICSESRAEDDGQEGKVCSQSVGARVPYTVDQDGKEG